MSGKKSGGKKKRGQTHCVLVGKKELACYKTKAKARSAAKARRKRVGKNGKHLKARVKSRAKK